MGTEPINTDRGTTLQVICIVGRCCCLIDLFRAQFAVCFARYHQLSNLFSNNILHLRHIASHGAFFFFFKRVSVKGVSDQVNTSIDPSSVWVHVHKHSVSSTLVKKPLKSSPRRWSYRLSIKKKKKRERKKKKRKVHSSIELHKDSMIRNASLNNKVSPKSSYKRQKSLWTAPGSSLSLRSAYLVPL